jgi:hypothetical protein
MRPLVLGALLAPSVLLGQGNIGTGTILGVTLRTDRSEPLSYAVASIPSRGQQTFSNDNGIFTLRNLPADTVRLRFKHIGFASRDTVVRLGADDTLRLIIALTPLAIDLPAIKVSGACGDKKPDSVTAATLSDLFAQVTQNAERYRLLADSNPFKMLVHRVLGFRDTDGQIAALSIDTIVRGAFPKNTYLPGHLINEGAENGKKTTYLSVPELADFADTAFTNNHCFTYAGMHTLKGDTVVSVEFEPAPSIRSEVDFKGKIYLRARDYELLRSDVVLSKISTQLHRMGIRSKVISTTFHEIVPGVPILWYIESNTGVDGSAPQVEVGQVFDVRWVKGPP